MEGRPSWTQLEPAMPIFTGADDWGCAPGQGRPRTEADRFRVLFFRHRLAFGWLQETAMYRTRYPCPFKFLCFGLIPSPGHHVFKHLQNFQNGSFVPVRSNSRRVELRSRTETAVNQLFIAGPCSSGPAFFLQCDQSSSSLGKHF